jgi:hypothetical protein
MSQRTILALSFLVAIAAIGAGAMKKAEAGHGYYDDYGYGGHGYSEYYPGVLSSSGYAPRFTYYRPYPHAGRHYYGRHDYHGYHKKKHHHHGRHRHHGRHKHHRHHRGHGGVYFSVDF